MSHIVKTTLPANGLDGIRHADVYERRLFTADQIAVLRELWTVREGTVQDNGPHKGTKLVQFSNKGGAR
jgi:hypothetical protein